MTVLASILENFGNYSGTLVPIKWRIFSFFINIL